MEYVDIYMDNIYMCIYIHIHTHIHTHIHIHLIYIYTHITTLSAAGGAYLNVRYTGALKM
jgi:hypothetical protein